MDAVAVEVATRPVVVLGGPGIGVPRQDLRVPERDPGVEGVGDRGVPQRMWADVPRDPGRLRDSLDHSVRVASVDWVACQWAQDQRPGGAFAAAGLEHSQDGHGDGHGGGLVALADQVQDAVAA
jgi:hypothetical protein